MVVAYVTKLGGITAEIASSDLMQLQAYAESNSVRCPDPAAAQRMLERLDGVRAQGDSLGGEVVIVAEGVPAGLGEMVFDKLDGDLVRGLKSIGAVKAVEIGADRECAALHGSEMNDPLLWRQGKVDFQSNHASGILGGISTGAPIVCTISVKPTPSIAKQQSTVDLASGEAAEIEIKGRHDPAIPPRIVPVAEAMVALVLADHLLRQRAARL